MSGAKKTAGCLINTAAKILLIFAVLLSAVTLYQNVEVVLTVKTYNVFVYLVLLIAVIAAALYFLIKFDIPEKLYILLTVFFSLVPRLCFVLLVQTPISGDFLLIYNAARDTVAGVA
ncbi:MAG: hypothetical protein GXZ01_02890 [Clostridiaceae bacterium]|mgnify:CR=1 FL=1|jgi:hypothetical protein|nr:hypothetical protein [Clostridiaceae bacterium]